LGCRFSCVYIIVPAGRLELLASEEINPPREMLRHAITFFSPQSFWNQIASWANKHYKIAFESEGLNPARIAERDLIYNLARFGYKEMGPEIKAAREICIEYMITSIMMRNEARRIEAIPILLAKNKANYSLLIFLSKKYGFEGRLLGILRVLNTIKPTAHNETAIKILENMRVKEIRADKKSIQEKMTLYNAA